MDTQLLSVATFLVGMCFWVGIPFSLLGMLLILGFKSKHWTSIAVTAIGLAGMSCWGLGLSIEGLVTGEALSISRSWGVVSKVQTPVGYWIVEIFWISLSIAVLAGCGWTLVRIAKTKMNEETADVQRP